MVLKLLISVTSAVALALFGYVSLWPRLRALFCALVAYYEEATVLVLHRLSGKAFATMCAASALMTCVCILVSDRIALSLLGVFPVLMLALSYLGRAHRARYAVEEQLPEWLAGFAGSVSVAPGMRAALQTSERFASPQMSRAYEAALRAARLGAPPSEVSALLCSRATDFGTVLLSALVEVAWHQGGKQSESFESLAAQLRERHRLLGVLRLKTADARSQFAVLVLMPPCALLAMYAMDPSHVEALFQTGAGRIMLGVVVVLWLLALIVSRKIQRVEM